VLTTGQKGAIAELAIAQRAIKLGIDVYRPLSDGSRSDLVFAAGSRLFRVQCKLARLRGDVVVVRLYSSRRAREGLRKQVYGPDDVDLVAAYCLELDRSFLLTSTQFCGRTQFDLRVASSRNNQRLGVNWAHEFPFEARLRSLVGP
jgi:hypothetical protein